MAVLQFANATLTSNGLRREAGSSGQLLNFPGHPPVNYLLHSMYSLSCKQVYKYIDFIVPISL